MPAHVTPRHVAALLQTMIEGAIENGLPMLAGRKVVSDLEGLDEEALRAHDVGPAFLVLNDDGAPAIEIRIDYREG
jgi:hypothetical protein